MLVSSLYTSRTTFCASEVKPAHVWLQQVAAVVSLEKYSVGEGRGVAVGQTAGGVGWSSVFEFSCARHLCRSTDQ